MDIIFISCRNPTCPVISYTAFCLFAAVIILICRAELFHELSLLTTFLMVNTSLNVIYASVNVVQSIKAVFNISSPALEFVPCDYKLRATI